MTKPAPGDRRARKGAVSQHEEVTGERASPPVMSTCALGGCARIDLTWLFWTKLCEKLSLERSFGDAEEEVQRGADSLLLRQIEVLMSQGKATPVACREAGISQQSYYRWRKEYGGLEIDQAKRMKELERENVRLRRLVADLSLEKQVLTDVALGNL